MLRMGFRGALREGTRVAAGAAQAHADTRAIPTPQTPESGATWAVSGRFASLRSQATQSGYAVAASCVAGVDEAVWLRSALRLSED